MIGAADRGSDPGGKQVIADQNDSEDNDDGDDEDDGEGHAQEKELVCEVSIFIVIQLLDLRFLQDIMMDGSDFLQQLLKADPVSSVMSVHTVAGQY